MTGTLGQAFTWSLDGGIVGLPNLAGRNFSYALGANDSGMVVGISMFSVGSKSQRPIVWQNGVASQLPFPPGYGSGGARAVNASGLAVGSAFTDPFSPRGVIYGAGSAMIITQTTSTGGYFRTALDINDFRPDRRRG